MYYNVSIRSKETAENFFKLFEAIYPELDFSLMGQWEPLRKSFSFDEAVEEWQRSRSTSDSEFGDYIFYGTTPAQFYAFVNWHGHKAHTRWADGISIMLDESFWISNHIKNPGERAIQMVKALSGLSRALYGRAFHDSEFEAKGFRNRTLPNGHTARESVSLTPREGIVDIFWLNYFGKPYIDIFGERKLKQLRSLSTEQIGAGFLIVTASDPFLWNESEVRRSQQEIKQELDTGAFLDLTKNFKPALTISPELE